MVRCISGRPSTTVKVSLMGDDGVQVQEKINP